MPKNSGEKSPVSKQKLIVLFGLLFFVLIFELPILFADRMDMEQYDNEIFSLLTQMARFSELRIVRWQDMLGFGSPLPIGFNLLFHPLLSLYKFLPYPITTYLFQVVHLFIALIFLDKILSLFKVMGPLRYTSCFLFAFSSSNFAYSYQEDWAPVLYMFNMLPVVVYFIERVVRSSVAQISMKDTLSLALIMSLLFYWSHMSLCVLYSVMLAFYALARVNFKPTKSHLWASAIIGMILVLVCSPEIYRLKKQIGDFLPGTIKYSAPEYAYLDWIAWAIRPLDFAKILGLDTSVFFSVFHYGARGCFISLAFFLCCGFVLRDFLRIFQFGGAGNIFSVTAPSLTFFVSVVLSCTHPSAIASVLSGAFLFRDPATLFGIMCFAIGTQGLFCRFQKQKFAKPALHLLILTLLTQCLFVFAPEFKAHLANQDIPFRGDVNQSPLIKALREHFSPGTRFYTSSRVSEELLRRGRMRADGIYASSDFARAGYFLIPRRYFKNLSLHKIAPDPYFPYGAIPSLDESMLLPENANFLGIDAVITSEKEANLRNLEKSFSQVGAFNLKIDGEQIYFFKNNNAQPRGVFFDVARAPSALGKKPDGTPITFLENNWLEFNKIILPDPVQIEGAWDEFKITFAPSSQQRKLLFRQLFRPEWLVTYSNGRKVSPVESLLGAFVVIDVPAHEKVVTLKFHPVGIKILTVLSLFVFLGVFIVVILCPKMLWFRRLEQKVFAHRT
ncbi:MAG: hypothetical protein IT289_07570 [Oligoflexia bacterium]|nr:hypothetical protein [Oligoflexia bacterium]